MLCIECTNNNIDGLYSKYKSEYIKLTICPRCEKITDKYVEYDNVLLFIDILLLKKQAYRHLAYNVTESEFLKDSACSRENSLVSTVTFRQRYKKLIRLFIMIVLFEVYLNWAYEEKNTVHSLAMAYILKQGIQYQYLYFIAKLIIEQLLLNLCIQGILRMLGWGSQPNTILKDQYQTGYYSSVLLITVLVSGAIKLFPILMLIWPYDKTSISASILNLVGVINITEALRIVTARSYLTIISVLIVATSMQLAGSTYILSGLVHYWSGISFQQIEQSEYQAFLVHLKNYKEIIYKIGDSWSLTTS